MLKCLLILTLLATAIAFKYGDKTRVNKGIWIKNRVKNDRQGKVNYFFPDSSFEPQAEEFMNLEQANTVNVVEFDRVKRDAAERGEGAQMAEKDAAKLTVEEHKKPTVTLKAAKVIYKFSAKNKTYLPISHPVKHENKTNETYERTLRRINTSVKEDVKNNTVDLKKDMKIEILSPNIAASEEDTGREDVEEHKCDSKKAEQKATNMKTTGKNNYDIELSKFLMLIARSFKKTMKRNEDIRKLSKKIQSVDIEYKSTMNQIKHKLRELESKQAELVVSTKNISDLQTKMSLKNFNREKNDQEIADLVATYAAQQQTLSNHQQLLENLEKKVTSKGGDYKETIVTGVLNEIVKKQNNFVKILNQLKKQYDNSVKLNAAKAAKHEHRNKPQITTPSYLVASDKTDIESAKINMLPTRYRNSNKLYIDDTKLLKDKATENIDDLVYKYYFNNTFIESTLKNDLAKVFEENEADRIKFKRTKGETDNTILMPIDKKQNIRKRRWIVHKYGKKNIGSTPATQRHSQTNHRRYPHKLTEKREKYIQYQHTNTANNELLKTDRSHSYPERNYEASNYYNTGNYMGIRKEDPYVEIAHRFCTKIGQDTDTQSLSWCIEKVKRKLGTIVPKPMKKVKDASDSRDNRHKWTHRDATKSPVIVTRGSRQFKKVDLIPTETDQKDMSWLNQEISSLAVPVYTVAPAKVKMDHVISISSAPYGTTRPPARTTYSAFFPDNEELEFNLKQSDVKLDTTGNVYYESFSDPQSDVRESRTASDILPDEHSDSRFIVDPFVLEMQSKRRAYVRRYNNMLRQKNRF